MVLCHRCKRNAETRGGRKIWFSSDQPIERPLPSTSLLQDIFGKHTLNPPKNDRFFFLKMFWDDTSEKWKISWEHTPKYVPEICWKSLNEAKSPWYICHKNPHETANNRFEIILLTAGFLLILRVAANKTGLQEKHPADSVGWYIIWDVFPTIPLNPGFCHFVGLVSWVQWTNRQALDLRWF